MAAASRGHLWVFRAAGLGIVLLGVYLAGGENLTCVRASTESPNAAIGDRGDGVAECRLETRRWLGMSIVGESRYGGVTRAETTRVSQTGEGAEDSWFVVLRTGDHEVGRVFGRRERVQAAGDDLRAWFEGGLRGKSRIEWSSWPFGLALLGFGLVLTVVTGASRRRY